MMMCIVPIAFLFAVVRDVQRNTYVFSATDQPKFLFAVVRDVQRNYAEAAARAVSARNGFYSLSCETYSGTPALQLEGAGAGCFYSLSCETYSGTRRPTRSPPPRQTCFYSLSCETYSGTSAGLPARRLR